MPRDGDHPLARTLRAAGWPSEAILPSGRAGPFRAAELVDSEGRRPLVVLSSPRPILPDPRELLERRADLSHPLRLALEAARSFAREGARLLAADPERFVALELVGEETLLRGETPEDWEVPLLGLLSGREGLLQRLDALPRRDAAKRGQDLGRFFERTVRRLQQLSGQTDAQARGLALGLLLSLFAWRAGPPAASFPASVLWEEVAALVSAGTPPDADLAPEAAKLLRDLRGTFARLGAEHPVRAWTAAADAKAWVGRWCGLAARENTAGFLETLGDFLLQSRSKLKPVVFEFALLPQEHQRRSASAELQNGLLSIPEALRHSGAMVYAPLTFDAREFGLGWALRHLGPLLDHWERVAERQREAAGRLGALGQEQDLFQEPASGADEAGLVVDPMLAALADSFRVERLEPELLPEAEALAAAAAWAWQGDPSRPERRRLRCSLAGLPRAFASTDAPREAPGPKGP